MANKSKHGPMMKINYDKIKETIEKGNLTGTDVSAMLGFHENYLSASGARGILPFDVIKQLSDLFGVKFEDFLAGSKTETEEPSEALGFPVTDDTLDTDDEEIMTLRFSNVEYKRIEELTKQFGLIRTTDLFHKLLDDAWFKYRKDKIKEELGRLPEEDLLKRYIASIFGTDKYNKDDLVRKIADDAMRRCPNA